MLDMSLSALAELYANGLRLGAGPTDLVFYYLNIWCVVLSTITHLLLLTLTF